MTSGGRRSRFSAHLDFRELHFVIEERGREREGVKQSRANEVYVNNEGGNEYVGGTVAALMAGATAVEGPPENNSVLYPTKRIPLRPPNYRETPTYYFALQA